MAQAGCDSFVRIGSRVKGGGKRIHLNGNCRYIKTAMKMDQDTGDIRYHRNNGIRGIYSSQTGEWLENQDDYAAFKVFCCIAKGWLLICEDCRRRMP